MPCYGWKFFTQVVKIILWHINILKTYMIPLFNLDFKPFLLKVKHLDSLQWVCPYFFCPNHTPMSWQGDNTVILVNTCSNMLNLPQAIAWWGKNSLSAHTAQREGTTALSVHQTPGTGATLCVKLVNIYKCKRLKVERECGWWRYLRSLADR